MKLKPSEIIIGKRIRKDLGDIEGLSNRIREHGLGSPIVVTEKNVLVDGFRRLTSWKLAHGDEPVEVFRFKGTTAPEDMEIEMAVTGKPFDPEELYISGMRIESKLKADAKANQLTGSGNHSGLTAGGKTEINLQESIAGALGIGHTKWAQIKVIFGPGILAEIGKQETLRVRSLAKEESVKAAYGLYQRILYNLNRPPKSKPELEGDELKFSLDLEGVLNLYKMIPVELTDKGLRRIIGLLQTIEIETHDLIETLKGVQNETEERTQIEAVSSADN